jgi:uncharacterized membrane protein
MSSFQGKKVILGIILIVSFLVLAFNIFPLLLNLSEHNPVCASQEECPHEQQLNFMETALPIIISISLIIGAGTYYLMSQKVEEKKDSLRKQSDILLKFLSEDEKKLVNLLIENNGKILQAEVTRLPGMSKVKSHRVVQKLLDKGVLEKDRLGKTNILNFSKEVKDGLL